MNISVRTLNDTELLKSTRELAQREREITTQVLRHLAEIERRKLYCDVQRADGLKYGSLFDYVVHELKYSEGAADRRISAMRLLKELPELEAKIEAGVLSLTNVSRAQKHFREVRKADPTRVVSREEKSAVLAKLEEKSSREGDRILFAMQPPEMPPRERVRRVSAEHLEVCFIDGRSTSGQTPGSTLAPRAARCGPQFRRVIFGISQPRHRKAY